MQLPLAALSQDARLVHDSLTDHPELKTPEAIASGPYGIQQLGPAEVFAALRELEAGRRAVPSIGGWSVVE